MKKQYQIQLTDEERRELKRLIESGRKLARKITRARILLLSDTGKTDKEISEALQVCVQTVHKVRKRFFNEKSINSLEEKPRPGKPPKLDGLTAAHITALACSDPPEGRNKWTLRLLADRAVELELVDTISHEGLRKLLKKTN
ncbi:MAG: helix-turn-helix domain-containing protein [Syntrophobacteraceae bacterium]|jgi:transposase